MAGTVIAKSLTKLSGGGGELVWTGKSHTCVWWNSYQSRWDGVIRYDEDGGLSIGGDNWIAKDVTGINEERCQLIVVPEEGGDQLEVEAHSAHFMGDGAEIPWYDRSSAEEFAYGYALTVHKAQGSQWDDVLLFDESSCFREDKWRWLYTGITRAAERITITRMS